MAVREAAVSPVGAGTSAKLLSAVNLEGMTVFLILYWKTFLHQVR